LGVSALGVPDGRPKVVSDCLENDLGATIPDSLDYLSYYRKIEALGDPKKKIKNE